jgi:XTP/dITP diphosphohydrolase
MSLDSSTDFNNYQHDDKAQVQTEEIASPPLMPPRMPSDDHLGEIFSAYMDLIAILRKQCPWDRKQTHQTLSHLLIEEVYETVDAIQKHDMDELKKELGDILLHIAMHSVIAEEQSTFTMSEILRTNFNKLVHRHPHVFGTTRLVQHDDVKKNWEQLKKSEGRTSTLEGVPLHLPALLRAQRIQEKVSAVGFDWKTIQPVLEKIREETTEFIEAVQHQPSKAKEEFGDILFSLVNTARFLGISPEEALQVTNNKFKQRFDFIEQEAHKQACSLESLSLDEMDALWKLAKQHFAQTQDSTQ